MQALDKIAEIYCIVDDFCKDYSVEISKRRINDIGFFILPVYLEIRLLRLHRKRFK